MAHIQIIEAEAAGGELREVYASMAKRPMPAAYRPPHGGPAGIQRAHSLDAKLMAVVFATSGSQHQGPALSWAERELIAASASRANQCLY